MAKRFLKKLFEHAQLIAEVRDPERGLADAGRRFPGLPDAIGACSARAGYRDVAWIAAILYEHWASA